CSSGTMCISPEGIVSPCIMSKAWAVGDVATDCLSDILNSARTRSIRKAIGDATNTDMAYQMGGCNPDRKNPCGPDSQQCRPCNPNGHCGPNDCQPVRT